MPTGSPDLVSPSVSLSSQMIVNCVRLGKPITREKTVFIYIVDKFWISKVGCLGLLSCPVEESGACSLN